ncbi:hypothetical protein MHYP_G00200510 [Metynnis hypsauchen]
MGEEAEDILTSLHLSPAEASEFCMVKNKLDTHFMTCRNIIFERAKFNQRQQELDTGADVTAVPETLYNQEQLSRLRSSKVLKGPRGRPLSVKGKFTATLKKGQKCTLQEVYVVEGLTTPLLGRSAATALQLVARLGVVNLDSEETVKAEFPRLFNGLGKLQGEYKPFSLSTPRHISLSLLPKVKEELNHMEQQGVISKVEQPTEWCAPMLVVPK